MEVLIDYLTFTSKFMSVIELVEKFKLSGIEFVEQRGYNGWLMCNNYLGFKILYGGRTDVCVDISGTGCRFIESNFDNKFDWIELLEILTTDGFNVSRLDVAGDDKNGLLTIDKMVRKIQREEIICKARTISWTQGSEEIIMIGARSSDTRLRIYNKAMERKQSGDWVRVEFQFRDKSADSFIQNLLKYRDIGRVYAGVLNNYIRFVTKKVVSENYNKAKICKWWSDFIMSSEKIKNIKNYGLEYNYGNLHSYLEKQCASSLRTFLEINNGNILPLLDIIENAILNPRQEKLIKAIRAEEKRAV